MLTPSVTQSLCFPFLMSNHANLHKDMALTVKKFGTV